MREPPRILIVDDEPINVDILQARLAAQGYDIVTASNGPQALAAARSQDPDLVLLDVMMPAMDGLEVCRRLKADISLPFIPVILVTALGDTDDVVAGLDAGADEYLTKPVDQAALVARVRSMLRVKGLHDATREQAKALERWNRTLAQQVEEQVAHLERLGRLKRFFSPQLAELIVSGDAEDPLRSHRRELTVLFLDLRGFTAFAERAEPEEVMEVLREYHAAMGELILSHQATLERFAGDGMMIFFNDPVPVPNPAERALQLALAMRERAGKLHERWRRLGYDLGVAIGMATGYATIGAIGFEGRWDYGAIGTVTNLAARLCAEAGSGQILISHRLSALIPDQLEVAPAGDLALRGFARPVSAFSVIGMRGAHSEHASPS